MRRKIKLKIGVIGHPGAGKSSFIANILNQKFNPQYTKTESYEMSIYKFNKNLVDYEINLWECGGDHLQYNKHVRAAFFKDCSAAFLIFDLCDENWKNHVEEWLEEAYRFDCFLVYAIGSKKDLYFRNKVLEFKGKQYIPEDKLTSSLLESNGIETINEFEINSYFEQFQVKHLFQSATDPIYGQIRNIFVEIEDDQHKITRSTLAQARRFDNTVVDNKTSRESDIFRSLSRPDIMYSVKQEVYDSKF